MNKETLAAQCIASLGPCGKAVAHAPRRHSSIQLLIVARAYTPPSAATTLSLVATCNLEHHHHVEGVSALYTCPPGSSAVPSRRTEEREDAMLPPTPCRTIHTYRAITARRPPRKALGLPSSTTVECALASRPAPPNASPVARRRAGCRTCRCCCPRHSESREGQARYAQRKGEGRSLEGSGIWP